jgi:hypothetical protein
MAPAITPTGKRASLSSAPRPPWFPGQAQAAKVHSMPETSLPSGRWQSVNPFRLLIKALALFALANLAFAHFSPPIGYFSIHNRLIPGRLRFDAQMGAQTEFNKYVLVLEDLDAMFSSHILSAGPKPEDEYRVFFLGDSSTWGYNIPPADIISEKINASDLLTCDGRRVRAYDIAYPRPSFARDLIILEKAVKYQPDLVIWPITLMTFLSRRADVSFLQDQADGVLELAGRFDLRIEAVSRLRPSGFWDYTLIGQRLRLKKVFVEQLYGLRWAGTLLNGGPLTAEPISSDVEDSLAYYDMASPAALPALAASLQFHVLEASDHIAGSIPMLFVNEPIYIATGTNSSIRYNKYYPRWAYDDYRRRMADWMFATGQDYLDLWDAIPPEYFIGSPLHLNPGGESRLAELLAPEITQIACP